MGWGLLALAAIQAGMAIYQAEDQKSAVKDAQSASAEDSVAAESKLVVEQQKARREAQGAVEGGTLLGGSSSRSVSKKGTTLTSNAQSRSLLGS